MTHETAKHLFGDRFIGPEELEALPPPFSFHEVERVDVPFSDDVLEQCARTHVLLYAPRSDISLIWLRGHFGVDPESPPCMYNQDWYLKESFAQETLDGAWHLLPTTVRDEFRAERPELIETRLTREAFPQAVVCAFAFFAYWLRSGGSMLWGNDFLWCQDRDHNDDRIYVGRYEDPSGVNKSGFNVHRHLALRNVYSAAPEIIP